MVAPVSEVSSGSSAAERRRTCECWQLSGKSMELKGQGPGLVNVLWVDAQQQNLLATFHHIWPLALKFTSPGPWPLSLGHTISYVTWSSPDRMEIAYIYPQVAHTPTGPWMMEVSRRFEKDEMSISE